MSYVKNSLLENEHVVYEAKVSWFSHPGWVAIAVLCAVLGNLKACLLVLIVGAILLMLEKASTELAITNKRVISKFGIFSTKSIELDISKIESIQVNQSMIGSMAGYGALVISGAGNPQVKIDNIDNPELFKKQFNITKGV